VDIAIRRSGLARIGGMPVMRRRIELLSHDILRCNFNGGMRGKFPAIGSLLITFEIQFPALPPECIRSIDTLPEHPGPPLAPDFAR